MDDRPTLDLMPTPTANRPLLGLTVLVVEDSRFACEALRLLCLRSGARIRRADCLASAHRHLQVYRPSVVIVDLGLPDGSGADLIADLAQATPRVGVIIGISGDDNVAHVALDAGADKFMAKPVESLIQFQTTILSCLPLNLRPSGPRRVAEDVVAPDEMAFMDDLAHAAEALRDPEHAQTLDYVAQFLSGVARSASDTPLFNAAKALSQSCSTGQDVSDQVGQVVDLVQERLDHRVAI